jgi:hypothetical protein
MPGNGFGTVRSKANDGKQWKLRKVASTETGAARADVKKTRGLGLKPGGSDSAVTRQGWRANLSTRPDDTGTCERKQCRRPGNGLRNREVKAVGGKQRELRKSDGSRKTQVACESKLRDQGTWA